MGAQALFVVHDEAEQVRDVLLAGIDAMPFPVLVDELRAAYRAWGLGRAPWWRVWLDPAVWAQYAALLRGGARLRGAGRDTLQLGGDYSRHNGPTASCPTSCSIPTHPPTATGPAPALGLQRPRRRTGRLHPRNERAVPTAGARDRGRTTVPRDLAARDVFLAALPGNLHFAARPLAAARVARALLSRPRDLPIVAAWAARFVRRAGARALTGDMHPTTYVMHSFMDASNVTPAWELLERGEIATDPVLRATRTTAACAYQMAHPDQDRIVSACVQPGVLDPQENTRLLQILPLRRGNAVARPAPDDG